MGLALYFATPLGQPFDAADGTRRIYAVEPRRLREVDDWFDRFRAFWLPHLDALATEVARGKRKRRHQE